MSLLLNNTEQDGYSQNSNPLIELSHSCATIVADRSSVGYPRLLKDWTENVDCSYNVMELMETVDDLS